MRRHRFHRTENDNMIRRVGYPGILESSLRPERDNVAVVGDFQQHCLTRLLRLLAITARRKRVPSLCSDLKGAARAEPDGAALGGEGAHTLVEDRAVKVVRRDRGAGKLAQLGKNVFQLVPGLYFQRRAARRKRSGHMTLVYPVPAARLHFALRFTLTVVAGACVRLSRKTRRFLQM